MVSSGTRHGAVDPPENLIEEFRGSGGLALLGPRSTRILAVLDGIFRSWAVARDAVEVTLPPLLTVAQADRVQVLQNFPHLEMFATSIRPAALGDGVPDAAADRIESQHLAPSDTVLPSSVCYGVYHGFADRSIPDGTLVTSVGRCFRNENEVEGLRRMASFQMREVVFLGTHRHVDSAMTEFSELTRDLMSRLGLTAHTVPATDPFFRSDRSRELMQKMSPVKHEFQVDGVAIASVNRHQNFFSERCHIRLEGTEDFLSTGCIGWGFERWLHVLWSAYEGDLDAVEQVLDNVKSNPQRTPEHAPGIDNHNRASESTLSPPIVSENSSSGTGHDSPNAS